MVPPGPLVVPEAPWNVVCLEAQPSSELRTPGNYFPGLVPASLPAAPPPSSCHLVSSACAHASTCTVMHSLHHWHLSVPSSVSIQASHASPRCSPGAAQLTGWLPVFGERADLTAHSRFLPSREQRERGVAHI